jgi:hypothetical protein
MWKPETLERRKAEGKAAQMGLNYQAVKLWPTITAHTPDMESNGPNGHSGTYLAGAVKSWMTPRACEAQNPPMGVDKRHHGLTHQVTKQWATPRSGKTTDENPETLGTAPSQGRCGETSDGAGEAMGNAEELRRAGLCQDAAADLDEQLVESANASGRQTQPPLGRDADGPADWLDDAELYTTCDNRTDELRLLGNGVVPAVAERAFRLLVGELAESESGREPANG